jgi:8-oxo-dGTP pyrophosphatase MutT (NUDIX family)
MTLSYPKRQAILAAAGVAVQDGCVLLLEDRWGRWGLPSGYLEEGEAPEETLRREIREELGVESEVVALLPPEVRWDGPEGSTFVLLHYAIRLLNRDFTPNEEVVQYRWVPFSELGRYNVWPNILRVCEEYRHSSPQSFG